MYHGDANERQHLELHMVRKQGGRGKWQSISISDNVTDLSVPSVGVQRRLWIEPTHIGV